MNIICIGSSEVKHVLDHFNSKYLDLHHDTIKEGRVQNELDLYLWRGGKNLLDQLVEGRKIDRLCKPHIFKSISDSMIGRAYNQDMFKVANNTFASCG